MARRFGRRRRKLVQWLPNLGTEPQAAGGGIDLIDFPAVRHTQFTTVGYDVSLSTISLDLTWDDPTENTIITTGGGIPSMADWQSSAWRLRRCVGKLFVTVAPSGNIPSQGANVNGIVTAGLIVRRVDATGVPLATNIEMATDTIANIRDPWIWRRTWILSPQFGNNTQLTGSAGFPISNVEYGSVADGPHVDAKTNRVIRAEERLFLNITGRIYDFNVGGHDNDGFETFVHFDYRLLGGVERTTNRRNASR